MPLPVGSWQINLNGESGVLVVGSVDAATGTVAGNVFSRMTLRGTWNEASQCLTFALFRETDAGGQQLLPYFFKGFLFSTPAQPTPGQDLLFTLAGSVVNAGGPDQLPVNASARRNEFGWFAQFTQVM